MDNLTEEEIRLKIKPENAPGKAESIRRFAMSVKINGLQNKVQKYVAYNHLLAYAAMVERCEVERKHIEELRDAS